MQLEFDAFGGADEDAAHATREELVRRFADWLGSHPEQGPAEPSDADLLLSWKWGYGDGHYGRWTAGDVDEVLLEHLPRKLSASPADAATIPVSLAAFVRFLDDADLLDPKSDRADRVAVRASVQTRSFLDAMADPANYGMAKRLFTGAGFEPGDVVDQAGLDAAMARFNDLSFEERGRILGLPGEEPGDDLDEGIEALDLPPLPLRLPVPGVELERLAAEVPLLAQVDALCGELGAEGVKLTKAGNLTLADARRLVAATGVGDAVDGIRSSAELPRLFAASRVALTAEATVVDGPRLRAQPDWRSMPVIHRWQRVVDAVIEAGAATLRFGAVTPGPLQMAEVADDSALHLLGLLWLAAEPVSVGSFAELLRAAAEAQLDPRWLARLPSDLTGQLAGDRVRDVLTTLEEAGLVSVADGRVSLTDGAPHLVGHHLGECGYDVVVPDDVLTADAGGVLDLVLHRDADPEAVAASWASAREPASAAADLVAALVIRPEPARVLLGFAMLAALGGAAVEAVRMATGTVLAPHAWLFLASAGEVDPDEIPRETVVQAGIDVFLATAETATPGDVIELMLEEVPPDAHAEVITNLATTDHPGTGEILELIGRHHPDKAVAKHARKAAHRWRSARGGSGHR